MTGTGNITSNPLFADTSNADFHLTQGSPCIDAGDPNSPLDPDSTRADMGALYFDQSGGSGLTVILTPHNPPVQIPSGGGSLTFGASIQNTSGGAVNIDAWTEVILPNGGTYGPLILRTNLSIPNGATVTRVITQYVPNYAPAGSYTYIANVGTHPGLVLADDSFPFTKLPGDGAANHNQGWNVSGWEGSPDITSSALPVESMLLTTSPNPFNQSMEVSFYLEREGIVELSVYDVNGREVARLAEGWYPAGCCQFNWNAAGLTSGMYFIRAQSGGAMFIAKALLIK